MIRPACDIAKSTGLSAVACRTCGRDSALLTAMARGHQVTMLAAAFQQSRIRERTHWPSGGQLRLRLNSESQAIGGPSLYHLLKY